MINEKGELIITWCAEDVLEQAKRTGIPCTEAQAHSILATMNHGHDCNLGITWDTIDYWLGEES